MPVATARLTRQQMYTLMWSSPMKEILELYDETNYTLSLLCEKHRIPRPPNGYWPSRRLGKMKQQPVLPECDDPALQMVVLRVRPPELPQPALDNDIMAMLEKAGRLSRITIAKDMGNLHPLLEWTRQRLEASQPDMYGLLRLEPAEDHRVLDMTVSRPSIKRAVLLLDAVVKALEPLGGKLQPGAARKGNQPHIHIAGEACSISVREHYTAARPHKPNHNSQNWSDGSYRKWDYKGSGMLDVDPYAKDTEWRRLEDRLNAIVIAIIQRAGWQRVYRRQAPQREKQHQEEERARQEALRIQQEQEYRRMQQQLELQRQQEAERARIQDLLSEAQAWQQSTLLHRYIRAARRHHIRQHGAIAPDSTFARKIAWAEQQADRMDPLVPSPPSILDPPPAEVPARLPEPEPDISRYYPPVCGGVVFDGNGRILLCKPIGCPGWTFARGKLVPGEVPKTAATREVHRKMGVNGSIPEGGPFLKDVVDDELHYFYLLRLVEDHGDFDHTQTEQAAWFALLEARERIAETAASDADAEVDLATLDAAGQAMRRLL